jgi:hypothetical protein
MRLMNSASLSSSSLSGLVDCDVALHVIGRVLVGSKHVLGSKVTLTGEQKLLVIVEAIVADGLIFRLRIDLGHVVAGVFDHRLRAGELAVTPFATILAIVALGDYSPEAPPLLVAVSLHGLVAALRAERVFFEFFLVEDTVVEVQTKPSSVFSGSASSSSVVSRPSTV